MNCDGTTARATQVGSAAKLSEHVTRYVPAVPEGVEVIPFPADAVSDHLPMQATFYPKHGPDSLGIKVTTLNVMNPKWAHHFHKGGNDQRLATFDFASKDPMVQQRRIDRILALVYGWLRAGSIVCLQEVPTEMADALTRAAPDLGFVVFFTGVNGDASNRLATLVPSNRYDTSEGYDIVPPSDKSKGVKGLAVFDRIAQLAFHVLNVHIPFKGAADYREAMSTYSLRAGGQPLLFMGDCNTTCRQYPAGFEHKNDRVTDLGSDRAFFFLADPAAGPVYTHSNTFPNAGNTTTRQLDAFDYIVLYGDMARMNSTFRLIFHV